ncbi:MAG TPA: TAT-variant-translocated molybdopterin oxidoreductase [Chthoniobacterales bacterium]|nr:TAT-variant-translocated molybdopterin oxidoreductase [Chthoniobacterales bacterium]
MKRVFQHPPEPLTGRKYWRSLGEYSNSAEFQRWFEREFPDGAAELEESGWSRRDFMKLMGASMALAGIGLTSCRRPQMHLVPFSKSVEWTIPGKFLYYATAMPRRTGAIPLIATTIDGRPVKLEGNPLHAASSGGTDVFAQASILDLYDPTRSRRFVNHGKDSTRADFDAYIDKLRGQVGAGDGLAFLVEEVQSPTRERLRAELEKAFPRMTWCVYEPALSDAQGYATRVGFGENVRLIPRFDRADVVLALDSDFLDCGEGDLASARAFTERRRVKSANDSMNRLYVVENRFTITGAMADHRLRLPASQIAVFAYLLAGKIGGLTKDSGLVSLVGELAPPNAAPEFDERWLTEMAADLVSRSGSSLVLAGQQQPVVVQLLAYAINSALKNIGRTIVVREFARNKNNRSILQLADRMGRGEIKQLFIFGGDPVYNAPRAVAQNADKRSPIDWAELQKKVSDVVRLGYHEDQTSAISQWHVPLAHYLESWGDALAADGSHLSIQPMILPLFGGLSEIELMNSLLGRPKIEGPELIQETFRATRPPGDFQTAWSKFLHDGFAAHVVSRDQPAMFNAGAAGAPAKQLWSSVPGAPAILSAPTADSPEIVFARSYAMDDGRYSNNGWLQEMPDPITKLTWDNGAMMSPNFAKSLGVETGDLVQIAINDSTRDADNQPIRRELVIAAVVAPGHAENSVTITLGYGRSIAGRGPLPYAGDNAANFSANGDIPGFNAYFLRTAANPHFVVADGKSIESIKVSKVGKKYPLSITQDHWSFEGRGLVREAKLDEYREDNNFVEKCAGIDEPQKYLPSIYSHPPLTGEQQWGMAVDLNVCTGCSACVIACQAENNVPVVGKLQVSHGRWMHWIRIDRYFASAKPFNEDNGEYPQDPEMVHQPMMCQHCENAPCETVCPVNATVHSEDGLNVMAYNRCVGTRYCSNNCPFKVRRFNFFDYNQRPVGRRKLAGQFGIYEEYIAPFTEKGAPDISKMQKNPNVTVRMRGVMEKCTFCVQRIEEAKIATRAHVGASNGDIRIPRDSFTTACAQACPHEAITFGDIKDPESKISKLKAADRNYRLLDYLNIKARTSYLARLRNPNPKMPDARNIGVASPAEKA